MNNEFANCLKCKISDSCIALKEELGKVVTYRMDNCDNIHQGIDNGYTYDSAAQARVNVCEDSCYIAPK